MNTEIFKTSNGDRPNIDNIAIVVTDGKSTWDTKLTAPYAKEARDNGAKVMAIGISDDIDMAELKLIASAPHDQTIFNVKDFSTLGGILDNLIMETCVTTTRIPTTTPSQTGEWCICFCHMYRRLGIDKGTQQSTGESNQM